MQNVLVEKYNSLYEKYDLKKPINSKAITEVIRESIIEFMSDKDNPAIYCNGGHTKVLMADYVFELKKVKIIIDNYAKTQEDVGYRFINEKQIEDNQIDGIVISSFKFKNQIKSSIAKLYPNILCLDIYEELEKKGIYLESDYYYANHPYHHYKSINTLQKRLEESCDEQFDEVTKQLITEYIHIQDFLTVQKCIKERIDRIGDDWSKQLLQDAIEIYNLEIKTCSNISKDSIWMLCLDGFRKCDFNAVSMPKVTSKLGDGWKIFENAYSYSTSTYESLIPVFGENLDLSTEYYKKNSVDDCRFVNAAKENRYKLFFYTDAHRFVNDDEVEYSGTFQTITQKLWDFILDAENEEKGLFYTHMLYESHFSFSNPYTTGKLIGEGTALIFDYLPQKGGAPRTDYIKQHSDAITYIDDVLAPFLEVCKANIVFFADHGNLLLEKDRKFEDIPKTKLICDNEWIRIPFAVKSKNNIEADTKALFSLMNLNEIVVSIIENRNLKIDNQTVIKCARSKIYNQNFHYIYNKMGFAEGLNHFEAFIFAEGYKLVVYADGKTALYTIEDKELSDDEKKQSLYDEVKGLIKIL